MQKFDTRDGGVPILLRVEGREVSVPSGANLAAGLLVAGVLDGRDAPRPLCLMGTCFQCVAEIDGRVRRTCRTVPREGMKVAFVPGEDDLG